MPILPRIVPLVFLRIGLFLLPLLAPFDVETYFRVHFTKVGAQTRSLLAHASAAAETAGLAHRAIDALAADLRRLG